MHGKTLLLLRHAKSSWDNPRLADHDRPLNKRGQRDAPRIGRFVRDIDLVPDLIVSSTAVRALTTAELVSLASGYPGEIRVTRSFYHADPEDYLVYLQGLPTELERVMVVGHNPGLEELLDVLTGEWERMPTAALAQIEVPVSRWADLTEETECRLVDLWRPRELPRD